MSKMIEALSVEMAFGDYATAAKLMLVLPAHDAEIRLEAQREQFIIDEALVVEAQEDGMQHEITRRMHDAWDKAHPEPEGKGK